MCVHFAPSDVYIYWPFVNLPRNVSFGAGNNGASVNQAVIGSSLYRQTISVCKFYLPDNDAYPLQLFKSISLVVVTVVIVSILLLFLQGRSIKKDSFIQETCSL